MILATVFLRTHGRFTYAHGCIKWITLSLEKHIGLLLLF